MAKNWTLSEAVKVITAGKDKEAIQELGKRFPLTTVAIAKIGENEGVNALMSVMPDHVTMLKLERAYKEDVAETDDVVDEDEAEDATEASADDQDLSEMTSKQLYALCTKRGIKAKKYGVNKQYYLDLLNASDEDAEDDEDDEAMNEPEEAEAVDYDSMKAPELYSLCKKRGIKTEPRQKAAVYIKALKAADAKASEADDDWDEEEEEVPAKKPEKKPAAKKSEKKPAIKKAAKKPAVEEDDEDDEDNWDI